MIEPSKSGSGVPPLGVSKSRKALRWLVGIAILALVAWPFVSRWGKGVLTPEEFEAGMQRRLRTVPEWEAYIKSASAHPQWTEPGNLLSAIKEHKSEFENKGSVYLFENVPIESVKWSYMITCMTDPFWNPAGLMQRHVYYHLLLDSELNVVGYRNTLSGF